MFENDNFRKIYVQVILIHFGIRIFKYRMIDCHHHVPTYILLHLPRDILISRCQHLRRYITMIAYF